jgi:dipeptidyl aminopeptidase/acylaminoacyl peptidase
MNHTKAMITAALMFTSAATTPVAAAGGDKELPVIGKNQCELKSDLMTPEALWAMGRIGSFQVSPDGKRIVYGVSYYSVQQNKSHHTVHVMNADGTGSTLLTTDSENEMEPVWYKKGSKIAFLRGGQVWEMNADGSERKQISKSEKEVEGFLFSPDESRVILIHSVPTYASIQKPEEDLPLATGMVITDMNYKHWDHYVKEIPHPFVAEVKNGVIDASEKDLLEGEPYECPTLPFGGTEQLCWNPASNKIAYTCRKLTGKEYALSTDTDIYLYDVESGTTSNLCKSAGYKRPETDATTSFQHQAVNQNEKDENMGYDVNPRFSPDGKYIAWQSMEREGYESDRNRLCVLNLTTGKKWYVTESFESSVEEFCWGVDSKTLYFSGVWKARCMVYSTNLKGEVKALTTGDYDYNGIALAGKTLYTKRHSISAPDDIYAIQLNKKNAVTQLTHENAYFLDKLTMGEVKERMVKTTDGKEELCWVIYPPHFDANKKYPTLLFCEGGPQSPVSQFWSVRWNFQIMAANGYIVIAPNRRGLPGFGMEWLEEISGDYTGQCMKDYLSAIDDLCNEPYVDKDRLGCVGASFGGFSVYYLAGHHDKRFKCFIAHDGIYNTQQQYVETEEMWFANWDLGGAPWLEENRKNKSFTDSPHLSVDKWDAPILCIHGEKDYRILSSQGESAFNAATLRGIPAELLLYPDENHWVLKPQNGILWQRTFFRWLDKWLK